MHRLAAWAVVALAMGGCSPSLDFERMRQQHRVDPYSADPLFADGASMRVPPAGTLPVADTRGRSRGNGAHNFKVLCAGCHGSDGRGQSVMARNMPGPPSPPLDAPTVIARTDDELLDIVSRGRNRMPGFDWTLAESDRRAVVRFVRELQRTGAHPPQESHP